MRRWTIVVAALLSSCGTAFAQTTTGMSGSATSFPPALGITSPLGAQGALPPTGNSPTGLPLGATEINPGGLSTTPALVCGAAGSSGLAGTSGTSSPVGTSGTFDGGGLAAAGSPGSTGATAGCTAGVSPNGTASPLSTPGATSTTLDGGTIPLGATELGGGGVSPLIAVPAPSSTTTAMPGVTPGVAAGP
jgi:hypothetical protein